MRFWPFRRHQSTYQEREFAKYEHDLTTGMKIFNSVIGRVTREHNLQPLRVGFIPIDSGYIQEADYHRFLQTTVQREISDKGVVYILAAGDEGIAYLDGLVSETERNQIGKVIHHEYSNNAFGERGRKAKVVILQKS